MVGSARLAAGLSGLRNRNTRVTNKTQLHVIRGNIEADTILIDDEEDEKNRILASQGVDEEDANEHHLQAALFASSQRTTSTANYKSSSTANDPKAYIPTPDATGLVPEYDTLYVTGRYKDSATHLRFSDSIDESYVGGLSGGFTYFLDERDAEWLERNNGAARGEGTSANGGVNSAQGSNGLNGTNNIMRGVPRAPRSAKAKGKEPEQQPPSVTNGPSVVISEDHFELVMGLFEKWTDESVSPYLHLAHDPEHFPGISDYERFFSNPLTPNMFASFAITPNLPSTEQMVQIAKAIYPWWRERRTEREGRRIVPQLNVLILEAQEKEDIAGGSPYICFRKRDVKPMRRTRTNNVTHTEKLVRLRGDLQTSLELAQMVLHRETLKSENAVSSQLVWKCREALSENMTKLATLIPGSISPGDESLLVDKERKPRKPRVETTASGRIVLTNRRLSHARTNLAESPDPHSPLTLTGDTSQSFELCQRGPSARAAIIQREIDQELAKTRKDDAYWEDIVDVPFQFPSTFGLGKLFKPMLLDASDSDPPPTSSSSHALRTPRSARLRFGRGGRLHLDRRLHVSKSHRLLQREWAGYPPRTGSPSAQEDAERWATRSWRPRHEGRQLCRRERQLGEEYWSHPSIYDSEGESSIIDQTSARLPKEGQDLVFGYEHSGFGLDGPYGQQGFWARTRDEEGWKPTPLLTIDSVSPGTARYDAERDRLGDVWHGRTADDAGSGAGGALALFMDGDLPENDDGQQETLHEPDGNQDRDVADELDSERKERAWRVEERWRYDSEGRQQRQDAEDRFLLDDFQSKFMRTSITLLDAQDHNALAIDPHVLSPPPLKQNRYLDHQLRMQNPGLPQPSATPPTLAKPPLPRQMSIHSRPTAPPLLSQNGNGIHVPLSLSPAQNSSRTTNGNSGSSSARGLPAPTAPNGTNALGLTPSGARLPPDSSGAGVRISTPVRTKHSPVNALVAQAGLPVAFSPGTASANGDTGSHGPSQPHAQTVPSYPSLKTAFGRVLGQQDQQQGRMFQKPISNNVNSTTSGDIASMLPMGVNNMPLKFPTQRTAQLRANGDNHGVNPSVEASSTDHYSQSQQQFALPRLPTNGSRTT